MSSPPNDPARIHDYVFEERAAPPAEPGGGGGGNNFSWILWAGLAVLLVGGATFLWWRQTRSAPQTPLPVELQANAPGAHFIVDGAPISTSLVNLTPGPHTAEAGAEGYLPESKTFVVSENGVATVSFTLQSSLPSLRVETALKGTKYALDGDDALDFAGNTLVEDRLIEGTHSLKVLRQGKVLFSVDFKAQPHSTPQIVAQQESAQVSFLLIASSQSSARIYGTRDWSASFVHGASEPLTPAGIDVPAGVGEVTLSNEDGEQKKLALGQPGSRAALAVSLKTRQAFLHLDPQLTGASILVDGIVLSKNRGGIKLPLEAGPHVVRVRQPHFEDFTLSRNFAAGETVSISLADMRQKK